MLKENPLHQYAIILLAHTRIPDHNIYLVTRYKQSQQD